MQNELDLKYKKESYIDSNISNTSNVLLSKLRFLFFWINNNYSILLLNPKQTRK